ncbi:TIM barrel protein [Oceanobacillus oncorhynchi subsp. oncorhynchi]|uniref:TIM barrel protein n=1 Tax=Oceanobacillus oncorhynchi TaxID=545501 RepID=UPI003627B868
MTINISGAPCCWGVDDPKNPYLPDWKNVLREAYLAGFTGIETGPYGYLPLDTSVLKEELEKNELTIVAGTIFDDLVSVANLPNLLQQVDDICSLITQMPQEQEQDNQKFKTPYLVVIDWGHDERDYAAGHPEQAQRLSDEAWDNMISHITQIANKAAQEYGVRAVVHPHAGGYIEFSDEILKLMEDIPYEVAGLCLDTGHLLYSKMDPIEWLEKLYHRVDYIHFKDIDIDVYRQVMNKKIRFFDACAENVMCPIGEGVIDYKEIYELLAVRLKYEGFITIEQERDPRNAGSSLADVKKSVAFLEELGFNK